MVLHYVYMSARAHSLYSSPTPADNAVYLYCARLATVAAGVYRCKTSRRRGVAVLPSVPTWQGGRERLAAAPVRPSPWRPPPPPLDGPRTCTEQHDKIVRLSRAAFSLLIIIDIAYRARGSCGRRARRGTAASAAGRAGVFAPVT